MARALERTTTVDDAQRREILNRIDEIIKNIWERLDEETRKRIDELFQHIKHLGDDKEAEAREKIFELCEELERSRPKTA